MNYIVIKGPSSRIKEIAIITQFNDCDIKDHMRYCKFKCDLVMTIKVAEKYYIHFIRYAKRYEHICKDFITWMNSLDTFISGEMFTKYCDTIQNCVYIKSTEDT